MALSSNDRMSAVVKEMTRFQRRLPRFLATVSSIAAVSITAVSLLANFKSGNPLWINLQALLHSKSVIPAIAAGVAVTGFFAFSITYLDKSLTSVRSDADMERRERTLLRKLAFDIARDQKGSSLGYEEMRLRLLGDSAFHERLAGEENLAARLSEVVGARVSKDQADRLEQLSKIKLVDSVFAETDGRLKGEIVALTRRANFNLAIGSTVTAAALTALIFMLFNVPSGLATTREAVVYFIPRLSTTIFIEIFAFFFLRLYKSSLDEVSNYQRLLTGLAKFRVATTSAYLFEGEAGHLAVLSGLCATDQKTPETPTNGATRTDALKQVLELAQVLAKASEKSL